MTKKLSILAKDLDSYANKTLPELEKILEELRAEKMTIEIRKKIRAATNCIARRKRTLKEEVMNFEKTNDHHLVVSDSSNGFARLLGHSVLFYSTHIAKRLGRRYKIHDDSDHFFESKEGVIWLRAEERFEEALVGINVVLDNKISTAEIRYYKLPRVYSEKEIADLLDRAAADREQIMNIIMPKSPLPDLYLNALELNQRVYNNCKHISDPLAKETFALPAIADANHIVDCYINLARVSALTRATSDRNKVKLDVQRALVGLERKAASPIQTITAQYLFDILITVEQLRNMVVKMENLRLIHYVALGKILDASEMVRKQAEREYIKRTKVK